MYKGQSFGDKFAAETAKLKIGNVLLMAHGHRSKAVKSLHEDEATRGHPHVQSAVEMGLRNAREWDEELPEDCARRIINRSNENWRGAQTTFVENIRFFLEVVNDEFEAYKHKMGFSSTSLHPTGPNSYYAVFYKFCMERWPSEYKDVGKDQWMSLRQVAGKWAPPGTPDGSGNGWEFFEEWASFVGRHADFTHPDLTTEKVIKALVVLTQVFDSDFKQSMPSHMFKLQFFAWSLLCFPNAKQLPECDDDMFSVLTAEHAAKLLIFLKGDMKHSIIYKRGTDVEVKMKAAKTAKTPAEDSKPSKQKRARGAKAKTEANAKKEVCVLPTEKMSLVISLADGKTRNKYFPEDIVVCENAALAKTNPSQVRDDKIIEISAICAKFAMSMPHGVCFQGKQYTKWQPLRKAVKYALADLHKSAALQEDADSAEAHGDMMDILETQNIASASGKTAKKAKWQKLIERADIVVKLSKHLADIGGKDIQQTSMFGMVAATFAKHNSVKLALPHVYTAAECHLTKDLRQIGIDLAVYVSQEGHFPEALAGLVENIDHLKALTRARSRIVIEYLVAHGNVDQETADDLTNNIVAIANLDVLISDNDMWCRSWQFILNKHNGDIAARLDNLKMLINPKLDLETRMPENDNKSGGKTDNDDNNEEKEKTGANDNKTKVQTVTTKPLLQVFRESSIRGLMQDLGIFYVSKELQEKESDKDAEKKEHGKEPKAQEGENKDEEEHEEDGEEEGDKTDENTGTSPRKRRAQATQTEKKAKKARKTDTKDTKAKAKTKAATAAAAAAAAADGEAEATAPAAPAAPAGDGQGGEGAGEKPKLICITFKTINKLLHKMDAHIREEMLGHPRKADVGHSYLGLVTTEDQKSKKPKKEFHLTLLQSPQSEVRLNFAGTLTYAPMAGAVKIATVFGGVDVYFQQQADVESGDFHPAWLVAFDEDSNKANIDIATHTSTFRFEWQDFTASSKFCVEVDITIPYLKAAKGCGLKKGTKLVRGPMPMEIAPKDCKSIAESLKAIQVTCYRIILVDMALTLTRWIITTC